MKPSINAHQAGHYQSLKIEPVEYAEVNNLGIHEFSIVKYVSRWKQKNGIDDLRKAKWYIDRMIELEERRIVRNFVKEEEDTHDR